MIDPLNGDFTEETGMVYSAAGKVKSLDMLEAATRSVNGSFLSGLVLYDHESIKAQLGL